MDKSRLPDGQKERLRTAAAQGMIVANLMVSGLLTFVNHSVLQADLTGRAPGAGLTVVSPGVAPGVLAPVVWLMLTAQRIAAGSQELSRPPSGHG